MKYRIILMVGITFFVAAVFRPILFKPFIYVETDIVITVVYQNESKDVSVAPYSKLSVIKEIMNLGDDVDYSKLNFNQVLKDGDLIHIPLITDTPCISINTGTHAELMTLTGVGNAIANRIIEHREEYGAFQSLESIMEVKGIKVRLFEKMKDMLCL